MEKSGPIVIIGFKGCGKSLIGSLLADRLKLEFVDTDSLIEKLYEARHGEKLPFREIFKKTGRDYFKELEAAALSEAMAKKNSVVSTGGGALMNESFSGKEAEGALFVLIKVDKDVLFWRIMKDGLPAFLNERDPRGSFEKFYADREPVYEKYADITVDNTDKTPEATAAEIEMRLKAFNLRKSES